MPPFKKINLVAKDGAVSKETIPLPGKSTIIKSTVTKPTAIIQKSTIRPDSSGYPKIKLNGSGDQPKKPILRGTIAEDRGASFDYNLGVSKDEDKDTHVIRTKTHPLHDAVESGKGMAHKVDSRLYKAYSDTIKTRQANYKPGDNINRPITGPASVFQGNAGNELESHFRGAEMEKKHADPNYNKTVYYGSSQPHGFTGVYKTEEQIPKPQILKPQRKLIGSWEQKNLAKTGTKYTVFK